MKMYTGKHAIAYKWTVDKLTTTIKLTVFPFKNTKEVHERVAEESNTLLHRDGQQCDHCKEKVD